MRIKTRDKREFIPVIYQNSLYKFKLFFLLFDIQILNIAKAMVKILREEEQKKRKNLSGVLVCNWYYIQINFL